MVASGLRRASPHNPEGSRLAPTDVNDYAINNYASRHERTGPCRAPASEIRPRASERATQRTSQHLSREFAIQRMERRQRQRALSRERRRISVVADTAALLDVVNPLPHVRVIFAR